MYIPLRLSLYSNQHWSQYKNGRSEYIRFILAALSLGTAVSTLKAFWNLEKQFWSDRCITIGTRFNVYKACILSNLFYYSRTCTTYRCQIKVLERFHQNSLSSVEHQIVLLYIWLLFFSWPILLVSKCCLSKWDTLNIIRIRDVSYFSSYFTESYHMVNALNTSPRGLKDIFKTIF